MGSWHSDWNQCSCACCQFPARENGGARNKIGRVQADFIFMDLDKPQYAPVYETIMRHGLLKPGGLLLCDNVLYRGLTAEADAGTLRSERGAELSEATLTNAETMAAFLRQVRNDSDDGKLTTLMMP